MNLHLLLSCFASCVILFSNRSIAQPPKITIENSEAKVDFSNGLLMSSNNLINWKQIASVSPYKERLGESKFYKVKDEIIRVPVIAHTGQSNSNGSSGVPNREPYLSQELPIFWPVTWVNTLEQTNRRCLG